jgi:hypothetical protein
MKGLVLVIGVMVSFGSFANSESFDKPDHPKGFNYAKHYRKAKFVRFMNRTFNLNNCKGKSHHES